MKKTIAALLAVTTLAGAGTIYPDTYIITETDRTNDLVTISDCNGYTYQFEGVEDYFVGDLVSCIMFDNFTPEITDDIIITQRYGGVTDYFDEIATPEY